MRLGIGAIVWICSIAAAQEVWTFDRLDKIGGHAATVIGHPRVVDTPGGKAIEFNGVDDGIFIDVHPLAGAVTFTWEAIFRPTEAMPNSAGFIWKKIPQMALMRMTECCLRSGLSMAGGVWTRSTNRHQGR